MVSNGLLATKRLGPMLPLLDGVAISFDGLPETHNAMRGRDDAFERAAAGLAWLAEQGAPVGAAISLTRDAIPELPELADHLVELGARALQIRRSPAPAARAPFAHCLLRCDDLARLYLVVLALQRELPGGPPALRPGPGSRPVAPARRLRGLLAAATTCPANRRSPTSSTPSSSPTPARSSPSPTTLTRRLSTSPGSTTVGRTSLRPTAPGHVPRSISGRSRAVHNRHDLVDWFDHCTRLSEQGHRLGA